MQAAVTIDPVKPALSVPVAASTDLVVKVGPVIWIGRLKTGRVAIFPASASKTSNAAAVVEILVVIASAVAALAAGEDLVDSVAAGVSEDAVAGSGADDNNLGLGFASNFSYNRKLNQPTENKHMKKLSILTNIATVIAALALITACETTGGGGGSSVSAQKEALLAQSGFKTITVTTPTQQQAVSGLAQGRVSAVKYNGKLYYVYPTATKDRIYVGRQKQFTAYKQALAAQSASQPSMAQQGQGQMAGQSLMPTLETAGPNNVEVQQFGGFGPMGVNALGDW